MELITERIYSSRSVKVYLREEHDGKETIYGQKDGAIFAQTFELSDPAIVDIIPLFEVNDRFFKLFLEAVVKFASDEGIKTENENAMKGKMEAMQAHMETLTKIVDKSIDKFTRE